MADSKRFQSAYLALLAVAWDDLEQIGELLGRVGEGALDEITLSRLEMFRLEFFLLEGWSREFAPSASERILNLEKLLDTDNAENACELRKRVLLAQNCLYDEARALTTAEPSLTRVSRH